jgi:hypothetical protein
MVKLFRSPLISLFVFSTSASADCWLNDMGAQTELGSKRPIVSEEKSGSITISLHGKTVILQKNPTGFGYTGHIVGQSEKFHIPETIYYPSDVREISGRARQEAIKNQEEGNQAIRPDALCGNFGSTTLDLGIWGRWATGSYMENPYFWDEVVFRPQFNEFYRLKEKLQKCQAELQSCINLTNNLRDGAFGACGAVFSSNVVFGTACFVGVGYLSDKALDDCWGRYASCLALAPSNRSDSKRRQV